MKKFIASFLLVCALTSPAGAWVPVVVNPLTWPLITSAALHLAAGAAALYYGVRGSDGDPSVKAPVTVDPQATFKQPDKVVWIEVKDVQDSTPVLKEKPISTKMSVDKARELAAKKDSSGNPLYPLSDADLNKLSADAMELATSGQSSVKPPNIPSAGEKFTINGVGYQCTSATDGNAWNGPGMSSEGGPPGGYIKVFWGNNGAGGTDQQTYINYVPATIPIVKKPRPLSELLPLLTAQTGNTAGGNLASALAAELDAMFSDPDYVPSFTDDTTGLPYAPPPGALSQAQIDSANNYAAATDAAKNAATVAAGNSSDAAAAATAAKTASDIAAGRASASAADAAAHPGDAGRAAQAAADAQAVAYAKGAADAAAAAAGAAATAAANAAAALAAAQTAGNNKASGNGSGTGTDSGGSGTSPTGTAGDKYGDGITPDFGARMTTFMTAMKSSAIFSLPRTLLGNIPSGGSPVFNLNFGRFGAMTFDLSSYAAAIALIRILVLFTFTVSCVKIITLKGGGV